MNTKKIKILFAINCMNIGGAPAVVFNQIRELDKNRFDPYLLTLYPSKKANFWSQLDFLEEDKIKNFKLKNRSLFDFKTLFKIFNYLRKEKFDIIYTHLFLPNLIIRFFAIVLRTKVILSFEHSMYFNKKRWHIFFDKFFSFFTNKILVSNKAIAEFTSKQEKIVLDKFSIIPNPVFIPKKKDVDLEKIRKIADVPKNAFLILNIGRYSEEKNQILLIEVAQKLEKEYPNFYFLLLGHGPKEKFLKEEIKKRKLKNCRLITEPEIAKEFLYISNVFVLPSLREGQSIVTYEALMAGLPVIVPDIESIRDIIKDEENGLIFKTGEVDSLSENIIRLHKDKELRDKISLEGRKSVDSYTEENNKKLESLLLNLYEQKF